MKNLKLIIDPESVYIYKENGIDKEPKTICYWHIEEWEEDANVAISIFNAITIILHKQKGIIKQIINN